MFKVFSSKTQQREKSLACVSVPLMGEKLPYYCRVKKILAALKNGPKLARPVVKSALEKLSLCLSFLIMLMDWLLAPVLISVSRDIDCQHVTVHCAMPLCTALCHYVNITIFCTFHRCTTLSACTLLKCSAQCTAVGLSVNKATSVSFKGDDNSLPSPHSHCNFYRISFM